MLHIIFVNQDMYCHPHMVLLHLHMYCHPHMVLLHLQLWAKGNNITFPKHMQVFDFTLSDDDTRLVESINKSWRVLIPMKEVSGTVPSLTTLSSLSNLSLPLLSLFTQSHTHSWPCLFFRDSKAFLNLVGSSCTMPNLRPYFYSEASLNGCGMVCWLIPPLWHSY